MDIKREIRPSSRDTGRLRNHFNIDKKRRTNQHFQPHAHFHPFYEIFFLINGHCRFFLHSTSIEMMPGSFLIIPPGEYHYNVYVKEPLHDRFALYCDDYYLTEDLHAELGILSEAKTKAALFQINKKFRPAVVNYLETMLRYYREADSYGDTMLRYMFPAFLLYLSRNIYEPDLSETEPVTSAMQDAVKNILSNYAENISLEGAAAAAGLAPTYFSRKFKEIVGTGFKDYLTFVRLREAAKLLRNSPLSISEVSRRCGFNSPNYFGDAFRRAYGISPSEYRQSEEEIFMVSEQSGNPRVSL
ncbi:MAG: helix-turn-helix domain-containing protein [Lachnospiraceae bacterium]|nr:helix-turn-helix domain-containing protein [Lachnospiraceae bacterium]